jgi:uncharacterized protein
MSREAPPFPSAPRRFWQNRLAPLRRSTTAQGAPSIVEGRGAGVLAAACLFVLASSGAGVRAQQPSPPELTAPVNDFANVISAEQEAELDSLSRKLQAASGDVLVVATVKTFQPFADLPSYTTEMFENHGKGIGQKGRDNGLLLVLAVDDRQVRVEPGYDLEGIITDGFAGQVSREVMVPFFRKNDYGGGLVAGATRLAERIAQVRGVTLDGVRSAPVSGNGRDGGIPIVFIIFLIIIFINVLRGALHAMGLGRGRRGRRWTSGVGPFGSGYGGWSGGSGWGGGGGFGGGFGGFGGGRSGGGGGGASW